MDRSKTAWLAIALLVTQAALITEVAAKSSSLLSDGQTCSATATGSIEGAIASLNLDTFPTSMKISKRDGTFSTVWLDTRSVSVTERGRPIDLDNLQVGQIVKICHGRQDHEDVAQSIELLEDKFESTADGSA